MPLTAVRPPAILALITAHAACIVLAEFSPFAATAARLATALGLAGYLLAFALALSIAREHARSLPMRLAWLAIAADCFLWFIGKLAGGSVLSYLAPDVFTRDFRGLLMHLAIVPADVLLLGAMLAMWWSVREAGIGFCVRRTDYAWMTVLVGSMAGIIAFRAQLTEADSPYPGIHLLQQTGLLLISMAAAASLVLRRFALDIGHGRLALVLQCLAVHAIGRCIMVFLRAGVRNLADPPAAVLVGIALAHALAHWSITLAASYRAALAADAARQIVRLEEQAAAAAKVSTI